VRRLFSKTEGSTALTTALALAVGAISMVIVYRKLAETDVTHAGAVAAKKP
jgi:hypothetical protein